MKATSNDIIMQNRVFVWVAVGTGLVLLIPLIAMQFSSGVNWTLFDFVVMGALLFGTSLIFVLIARRATSTASRLAIGAAVAVALLYVWAELAVGVFTNLGS
jgi:hypothetical protein